MKNKRVKEEAKQVCWCVVLCEGNGAAVVAEEQWQAEGWNRGLVVQVGGS
jgi:hypothetical protein